MRNYCETKAMSLKDIANALTNVSNNGDRIVVPRFQRGKRWSLDQKQTFINSINQGFPVGSLLFYERAEQNRKVYVIVDGLQRGSCIKDYIQKPYEFFELSDIPQDLCDTLASDIPDVSSDNIRSILLEEIKAFSSNFYVTDLAKKIMSRVNLENNNEALISILNKLEAFKDKIAEHIIAVSTITIPVIVYNGPDSNLHIIFDRINSKGTPLSLYEIYAASWPDDKYEIKSSEVLNWYHKRDLQYRQDNLYIDDNNCEDYMKTRKLSVFEFMFGFSKYLVNKYSILSFNTKLKDDEINSLGFELVDACLNSTNQIPTLYQPLKEINLNELQSAIEKSIEFVTSSIMSVSGFKGNNRDKLKIFHSKFQIMSMIASVFNTMYQVENYKIKDSQKWDSLKKQMARNLLQYYIHDIIERVWFEGGTSKIYRYVRDKQYLKDISDEEWNRCLDSYYRKSLEKKQQVKFDNPSNEDYVILNTVYMSIFSAQDQIGTGKYDVEHIAPKAQMKELIKLVHSPGLPVSSIANLCYLPEDTNRKKQSKNFYQDRNYLGNDLSLEDVEKKYSFTCYDDLSWMDKDYAIQQNALICLEQNFKNYLDNRFAKIKKKFCRSLGIKIIESQEEQNEQQEERNVITEQTGELVHEDTIEDIIFHCSGSGAYGQGYYNPENGSFTLLQGATVRDGEAAGFGPAATRSRNVLIANSTTQIDGKITTTEDLVFTSPSAASNFLLGHNTNGKIAFKNAEERTLKEFIDG